MKFVLLAFTAIILGVTAYGACNKIDVNHNIESLEIPSIYQIDYLLDNSTATNIGTIMEKYGTMVCFSHKEIEISNYLYAFDRTHPFLSSVYLTLPILYTWISGNSNFAHKLLVISILYLPFLVSWFLSKRFIFSSYNEDCFQPSKRTSFPTGGGFQALEHFFDKEEDRVYYIIGLRSDEMKRQKKVITYCNSIRIATTVFVTVLGITLN